jgi:Xaa-Pro dipeptidase
VDDYCSDITRTFAFKGVSKERTEMLETVKEAQRRAIAAVKAGEKGSVVYNIANDFINNAHNGRYRNRFIHGLGHHLGLEVHDCGSESNAFRHGKQENILKEGMVLTVEPGIYIPGFGGARIEDDILVTKKGHVIL